jgi:hypothetical protein
MKSLTSKTIRVRYGIYPILILALLGFIIAAFLPPIGIVFIASIALPLLIAISVRPFMLINGDDIRCVSLLSNKIFSPLNKEELSNELPSMKWLIRKRDMILLSTIQNPD